MVTFNVGLRQWVNVRGSKVSMCIRWRLQADDEGYIMVKLQIIWSFFIFNKVMSDINKQPSLYGDLNNIWWDQK